ncbi:MAG: HlyD family efflux transporter periplasmic adaptor subunit [Alphaproteobacteria bacterium]|nr:HlyD family efflux transporter periplasmic adaptor subunit [Alphaproteobacteria bacterium]
MRNQWIYTLVVLGLFIYCGVMIAPYVRSTLERDASVTAWSRTAVAPISGRIVDALPTPGDVVGPLGHITTIENHLLLGEQQSVEELHRRIAAAMTRVSDNNERLQELSELEAERVQTRDSFAKIFHRTLEAEIENLQSELVVVTERVGVLERIAGRQRSLEERGVGAEAILDEALLRLAEARARKAQLEASLNIARLRDQSAEADVFVTAAGDTPDWLHYGEFELKLEERSIRHDLRRAEADLSEALEGLQLAQATLEQLSKSAVNAPPGAIVFSVTATPGATVQAGATIIEWVDCSVLLVDVPVADAEASLIKTGDEAEVILEGESTIRKAMVELVRGSSATLGRADLAAIAKGRTEGVAQAILSLDAGVGDFDRCPVGRAAYVRFPGVGLLNVLKARLRL